MSLDAENVYLYKTPFDCLEFSPNATRKLQIQAGGFVWSDEEPDFHAKGRFPIPLTTFLIYLIGYRAWLIGSRSINKRIAKIEPIWESFRSACPTWPGFRAERCDSALLPELEFENDQSLRNLERLPTACERKRSRRDSCTPNNKPMNRSGESDGK